MKKHDTFELWLHGDDALSELHGAGVVLREPLQAWPLSVVERITFADGASRIYKAFRNLPTEADFYRAVRSRHIPKVFYSHSDGDRHWLLLEDVGGRHPGQLDREQALRLAQQAREIVSGLGPAGPYRYDLSERGYSGFVNAAVGLLRKLHQEQKLEAVDGTAIARIEEALSHPEALRAVRGRCALLHGDLKCNNILLCPDGELVLIDWQNILFGPEDIDIYTLLASQDIDPVPVAGIGPEILRMALAVKWLADCIDRWLPQWAGFYGGQIAALEENMRRVIKKPLDTPPA